MLSSYQTGTTPNVGPVAHPACSTRLAASNIAESSS